jgi:hypothetical protein
LSKIFLKNLNEKHLIVIKSNIAKSLEKYISLRFCYVAFYYD